MASAKGSRRTRDAMYQCASAGATCGETGGDHGVRSSRRRVSLVNEVVRRNGETPVPVVGRRGLIIIPATGGGVTTLKRTTGLVASKKQKVTITEPPAETGDRGLRFLGCTHYPPPQHGAYSPVSHHCCLPATQCEAAVASQPARHALARNHSVRRGRRNCNHRYPAAFCAEKHAQSVQLCIRRTNSLRWERAEN